MTTTRFVVKANGVTMGVYAAETRDGALDAYARDAGYLSFADACRVVEDDTVESVEAVACGYVRTHAGSYLLQIPADNVHGFSLVSDDQTWPGGVGLGAWEMVSTSTVPAEVANRLDWILAEAL